MKVNTCNQQKTTLLPGHGANKMVENAACNNHAADLAAFIESITANVRIEKIYCLNHHKDSDGNVNADLLILLPQENPQTFREVEFLIQFATPENYQLNYQLFRAIDFENLICEGNIFYVLASAPQNLVYDDGYFETPQLGAGIYDVAKEKAENCFRGGTMKARYFYSIAETVSHTDKNMAAFLLNQATDLCLNSLITSLTGQRKYGKSIGLLMSHNHFLNASLPFLSDENQQESHRLLQVLERANTCFRYFDNFQVVDDDLKQLFEKLTEVFSYAESTFNTWLSNFDLMFINEESHD